METKTLSLFALSIFAVVLLAGLASAAISLNPSSQDLTIMQSESGSFTFTIENTAIDASEYSNFTKLVSNLVSGTNTISSSNIVVGTLPSSLPAGNTNSAITITVNIPSNQAVGNYTGTLTIDADSSGSPTGGPEIITLNVEVTELPRFCESGAFIDDEDGNAADLNKIDFKIDISNDGLNKDSEDDVWYPLDTINVEVTLDNKFNSDTNMDLNDLTLVLGIFSEDDTDLSDNIAEDMIWISNDDEEADFGSIDADEKDKYLFEFRVNPENFEKGKYKLMVKAYTDEEPDTDEGFCIDYSEDLGDFGNSDYYAEINLEKESSRDQIVVVDTGALPQPLEVSCGSEVTIYPVIYNVGDKDFSDLNFDDQIKVRLYNSELGIDMEKIISADLDAGDNAETSFTFVIPTDADENKAYTFHMKTYYDYDEDDETYDEISDSDFTFNLLVKGGTCIISEPASVSANIQSGGKAGQPLSIAVTVKNIGSKTADYSVSAVDYTGWASSATEEPSTITLTAGQDGEVIVTFDVLKSASGEQEFELEIYSGGKLVATQPVVVPSIEKAGFSFLTGNLISGENWYIWGIGAFNLVLIVAIVIIAVRVARRKRN